LRYNDSFAEKWGSYILGKRLKFSVNHAWRNIQHCGKCQGQVRKARIDFLCHKSVFSKQSWNFERPKKLMIYNIPVREAEL
jgi:hypothetical protein